LILKTPAEASPKRTSFIKSLTTDLSTAAQILETRFEIKSMSAGSIIVALYILHDAEGREALDVVKDVAAQVYDASSRLCYGAVTHFAQEVAMSPQQLLALTKLQHVYSLNSKCLLEVPAPAHLKFSCGEAARGGGVEARQKVKLRLLQERATESAKHKLHVAGNTQPLGKQLLPPLPDRVKFQRSRAERDVRLATLAHYIDEIGGGGPLSAIHKYNMFIWQVQVQEEKTTLLLEQEETAIRQMRTQVEQGNVVWM